MNYFTHYHSPLCDVVGLYIVFSRFRADSLEGVSIFLSNQADGGGLMRKEVKIKDGRYIIFYTCPKKNKE